MPLQFGIDIVLKNLPHWKEKRIGILTNDAAKTNKGIISRIALKEAGFNLVKIFSPEHGISAIGKDGAYINNSEDALTGLPIISLYGEKFMPSEDDLTDVDIMLFDVPDAGTRFYTYLWSMTYWIEAAAKYNKPIIILDRPNPLGGNMTMCEGPMLDAELSSFIGRFNIPIKHQCTLGELANYFNASQNWNANLKVIQCDPLNREKQFYDWNIKWVNPSPALQNIEANLLYPGLCFFEATNVSVGRGTDYSFEWIGADWFNLPAIIMVCQNILRDDIKTETLTLPISDNGIINNTKGIRVKVIDPKNYDAVLNGLLLMKLIKDIHPKDFKWMPYPTTANPSGENHLSLLLGIPNAEALFDLPLQQWLQQIIILLSVHEWRIKIEPYLLYHS
jgi:uncharacterized protein YbbC (DUF1343 family)